MIKGGVTVKASGKGGARVKKSLLMLKNSRALVGIPQQRSSRKSGKINNAELLYILTNGADLTGQHRPPATKFKKSGIFGFAQALYIQSKGSPGAMIPPRPVIEPALVAKGNQEPIQAELKNAAQAGLNGDAVGVKRHLDRAGLLGENASRAWFTDPRNNWAPNAPSTIRRKGSDRPNVDTGELRKALTHVTELGK